MRTELIEKSHRQDKRAIQVADLTHMIADSKYVEAHAADGVVVLDESLVKLEAEFGEHLLRINRGILVARGKAQAIHRADGQYFLVVDGLGALLPISRRYVARVRQALEAA